MKNYIYILFSFFAIQLNANNIQISNISLTGQNTSAGSGSSENHIYIQFDLSWENSWKDTANYDAAWVFIKYKLSTGSTWDHATLDTANDHSFASGFTGYTPTDGAGIFIYRDAEGVGNVSGTEFQIKWMYALDGVADDASFDIQIFAYEMVYVPECPFYVGTASYDYNGLYTYSGTTRVPYQVTSEDSIEKGSGEGKLTCAYGIGTGYIPATFPKGYQAFYCMKYEISQGQYTAFLNTLIRTQQRYMVTSTTTSSSISAYYVLAGSSSLRNRSYVRCPSSGNGTTDPIVFSCAAPELACGYLTYQQTMAFLDWSGLRPMTEMEFEKACRGPEYPVAQEYPWGTTDYYNADYYNTYDDTDSEYVYTLSETLGNAAHYGSAGSINGVFKVGSFANDTTNREQSGSTYYGIMDMAGNVWERIINVYYGTGFEGSNGDGEISSTYGYANQSDWPGYVSSTGLVSGYTGSGYKGSSIAYGASKMRVSDREWISYSYTSDKARGGRGVRTAQ